MVLTAENGLPVIMVTSSMSSKLDASSWARPKNKINVVSVINGQGYREKVTRTG